MLGQAYIALPSLFIHFDLDSWRHLVVLATIALVVGNAWYVLHRYTIHNLIDYFAYCKTHWLHSMALLAHK